MKLTNKNKKPLLGITIGDPNGVGLEVIMRSLSDDRILQMFTPIIYASNNVLQFYKKVLGKDNLNFLSIRNPKEAKENNIHLLSVWNEQITLTPGKPSKEVSHYGILSLKRATEDLVNNQIDAIVTAPISKELSSSEEFQFAGHSEFFLSQSKAEDYTMMMVSEELRVALATVHTPLAKVPKLLSQGLVLSKLNIIHRSLQLDFGIKKPRIGVLGLNPHSGENGLLGTEEKDIIKPAIESMKHKDLLVDGPFPADTFFATHMYDKFDCTLAMFHDQGLIPFKTLAFDEGVNYTAGLEFVRTSPDHGTAFEITGKKIASPNSFRNSLYLACDIIKQRSEQSPTTT